MNSDPPSGPGRSALAALQRYLRPRAPDRARCELCSAELADDHDHLVELSSRRLCCACEPCAILFSNPAAPKYRRVPRDVHFLADFRLTDVQWEGLQLPINLAFFLHSTPHPQPLSPEGRGVGGEGRVVAFYPSPAGATEALPPPDAWQTLVEDNPGLRDLEPDVEALLVNRLGSTPEHYRVGVDQCYALVGLVRTHWRGLSGGPAVWAEIERFFKGLRERSGPSPLSPLPQWERGRGEGGGGRYA
jgi:hypothetical protein